MILQMTMMTKTALTATRNMVASEAVVARKSYPRKRRHPPNPRVGPIHPFLLSYSLKPQFLATSRPPSSDSDSEYGARSKKKKKPRVSGDEVRTSSRGVKVPNYADDVEDFEQFDEPHPGYWMDPNSQEKENDEIEAVLGHARDEGHEDDPEDLWYDNLVSTRSFSLSRRILNCCVSSAFTSSGKGSPIYETPTRHTSSSSDTRGSSGWITTSKRTKLIRLASQLQALPQRSVRRCFWTKNAKSKTSNSTRRSNV